MEVEQEPGNEPKPEDGFKAPMAPPLIPPSPEDKDKAAGNQEKEPKPKSLVKSPAELAYNSKNPPLAYKEPPWAGLPPTEDPVYILEEIKNGTIVGSHKLTGKSFFVVGRLPTCDIQQEHPSLSRFHAILQYKSEDSSERPAGFYLYDMGSTHGTFHNKQKCFPKTYYRFRVGHSVKFGLSTRYLILQGPQTDMEDESELSVTELKALAAEKARKKAEEDELKRAKEQPESSGISWGISDEDDVIRQDEKEVKVKRGRKNDDDEDVEMPDMENNPFAVSGPDGGNEKLYSADPKKFLQAWFEREGFDDLDFECTEKGFANFHVKIDLPIDVMGTGEAVIKAEVTHKGKKKDAITQCALEACRLLDKYGALSTSNKTEESMEMKRARRWEQNDYYSSDEDEYLDRTRTIQEKREKRMKLAQKNASSSGHEEKQQVETFESLTEKHSNVSKEIAEAEHDLKIAQDALANAKTLNKQNVGDDDDLDAYMAALSKTGKGESASKENISKLKQKLNTLKQDLARIDRLIEIARPAKLPEFKPREDNTASPSAAAKSGGKFSGIMIGKRRGVGIATTLRTLDPAQVKKPEIPEVEKGAKSLHISVASFLEEEEKETSRSTDSTDKQVSEKPQPMKHHKQELPKKIKMARPPPKIDDSDDSDQEIVPAPKHFEEEEEVWVPPPNQTGDGRTSLNDKFGY